MGNGNNTKCVCGVVCVKATKNQPNAPAWINYLATFLKQTMAGQAKQKKTIAPSNPGETLKASGLSNQAKY